MIENWSYEPLQDEEDLNPLTKSIAALTRSAGLGLWKWDVNRDIVEYSHQLEKILGYEKNELKPYGDVRFELIYKKYVPKREILIQKLLNGEIQRFMLEELAIKKDSSLIWLQEHCAITSHNPDGTAAEVIALIHDISEFKESEAKQKAEAEHWESLANTAGVASWLWDLKNDYIKFNKEHEELLGYPLNELNGGYDFTIKFVSEKYRNDFEKKLKRYLSEGGYNTFCVEIPLVHRNGNDIWTLYTANVAKRNDDGSPAIIRGGVINIDHRVRAEEQLRETLAEKEDYNKRLQKDIQVAIEDLEKSRQTTFAMFEANPYINLLFDEDYNLIDCNPVAISFFGFLDKKDFIKNFIPMLNKVLPQETLTMSPSLFLLEKLKYASFDANEIVEVKLDLHGTLKVLHANCKQVPYRDTHLIVVYIVDVTEMSLIYNELKENSNLLSCINDVAAKLLNVEPEYFDETIYNCMGNICNLIDADRMYIWKNFEKDGKYYSNQIYEWSENVEPQQGNPKTSHLDFEEMPLLWDIISKDETVNSLVAERPEYERSYFEKKQIKSFLMIPIILQDKPWGFVGLDDCIKERVFTKKEESILRSAANILVSGLMQNLATKNLLEAREEALSAMKAKSEFLSRMSHEIRTPMNAIIGMTAIGRISNDMGKLQYCLEKIEQSSHQLLGIINDVLDMSKIDANKFEIISDEFDFEKMMDNVFNVVNIKMIEKHQEFSFNFEKPFTRMVVSDELRLSQVLTNLISNAIKFTPECGTITLSSKITPIDDDNAKLRMCVSDTGIGIEEEYLTRIFDSFEQVDGGVTRKYGGTGLGLSICKKIITLMGGSIWVENSENGSGANFIFEIDIHFGSPLKTIPLSKTINGNVRILVVDDTPDVLDYFENMLECFGLGCDVCSDGYQAIDKISYSLNTDNPYNLVFLDWRMPGMNGTETARKIKEITNNQVLVIMISSIDWVEIEKEIRELEIQHFLHKPILPSTLFNKLLEITNQTVKSEDYKVDAITYDWTEKQILLVEDIEINREIVKNILEETNIKIDFAKDGIEGVEAFQLNPEKYDIILMDVQMPRLDGLAATRRIRSLESSYAKEIPIIAMTANAFKEDVQDCISAGMTDYLAKPIDIKELFRILNKNLYTS